MSPFLAWGGFHARSRFARSAVPEEKWGTTRSLTLNRLDVIIVNGMMYQVNQRCRFLSWTGTMNRCYWCILGLHAHAIYSDVISFCTERVLFGNTVDHFRRSWIYDSFSTEINNFIDFENSFHTTIKLTLTNCHQNKLFSLTTDVFKGSRFIRFKHYSSRQKRFNMWISPHFTLSSLKRASYME